MRRITKLLLVFAAILLVLPTFLVTAASNDSKSGVEKGKISSKDEVVYAKLSATGERQEIYVVNILDIDEAGSIVDYGPYTSLKNLTDSAILTQEDNRVEFTAPEGKFYYQGNMNEEPLPWEISVSYYLNGNEIYPEELAGKNGQVEIKITTTANNKVDPIFFKNYLLQISLSLDLELFSNIQAQDGILANVGKNKQVTFTILPENEEEFIVEADVVQFEIDGIDITAIPSSMSIDAPNINEMTDDMETLANAIKEINNGVGELNKGVTDLNNGVTSLGIGSKEYRDGIASIAGSSSELVSASKSIEQALETFSTSLTGSEEMELGDLKELEAGLVHISDGLRETAEGLGILKENYATAYKTLNSSMEAIPDYVITEEQIQQLYNSGANQTVINQLIETYSAARTAKGTYLAVKEAFDTVTVTLEQVSGTLTEMADGLDTMANGLAASKGDTNVADSLAQLQDGISQLSSNYKDFHTGLVDYTGGVGQLSSVYQEMHVGIGELSKGTGELENGVNKLYEGTTELQESTNDLPAQMKQEVSEMMAEFDKSDFKPVSFVSPQNENIHSVQFVFKTESIKKDEPIDTVKLDQEPKGFWARLIELFR